MLCACMTGDLSRRNPVCIDTRAVDTQVLSCIPAVIVSDGAQGPRPFWRTGTTRQKIKLLSCLARKRCASQSKHMGKLTWMILECWHKLLRSDNSARFQQTPDIHSHLLHSYDPDSQTDRQINQSATNWVNECEQNLYQCHHYQLPPP